MGSSTLLKLLRTQSQSATKILARSHKPSPLLLTQTPKLTQPIDPDHLKSDFSTPNPTGFSHFYPTFSFGYLLNPIAPPPILIQSEFEEDETTPDDCDTIIRADSVKKKRKKKMNKHKLRKLRKRLRRKTKT